MASRTQAPGGVSASAPRSRTRKSAQKDESQPAAAAIVGIPDDMRRQWVAEAAYFIAERRGFSEGSPEEDWLEAEAVIERMLAATRH